MEYVADSHVASIAWQGGEPTVMGLAFFQRVVELQQHARRPGTRITNSLQTNATTLDPEWATFFRQHGFLLFFCGLERIRAHDVLARIIAVAISPSRRRRRVLTDRRSLRCAPLCFEPDR